MSEPKKAEMPYDESQLVKFDNEIDEFPAHDWDENPVVFGTIDKIKSAKGARKNSDEEARYLIVTNTNGTEKVWESANLSTFYDSVKPGDNIVIRYIEDKPLKGGKTMRLFDVYNVTNG